MRHTARVRRALQSTLHPADRRAHPQVRIVLDLVLEIQIRDPQSLYAPGRNRSYKQIKYTWIVRKVCWIIKWTYQMFSLWLTGIKVTGYWWAERGRDGGSGLGRLGNGEFFYRTIKSPPNKRLVSILKYFSRLSWSSRRTWSPFLKQVIIILCLSDQQRGVIYHHCVRHSLVNSI